MCFFGKQQATLPLQMVRLGDEAMYCNAVIFDLFGTLVDFLPDSAYEQNKAEVARVLGAPVEAFVRLWRMLLPDRDAGRFGGLEDDLRYACRLLNVHPTPAQIARAAALRLRMIRRNLQPRDGAETLLTTLRDAGVRVGLVSDCAAEVPRVWGESPLSGWIDAPVFSCEAKMKKPDPRLYLLVSEWLGVPPGGCLYVGDGGSQELTGAARVGMRPVLICTPYERAFVMARDEGRRWPGPTVEHLRDVLGHARLES
jgi:putative hydrolase of the HAD superfamily